MKKYRYEAEKILLTNPNLKKVEYVDQGAVDFIAKHEGGDLNIKLETRAFIRAKNQYKNLWVMFPDNGEWYLVPHDNLIDIFDKGAIWGKPLQSISWLETGMYSIGSLSQKMLTLIEKYRLP